MVSLGINLVLMGFLYILLSRKTARSKAAPEILEQIRRELDEMVVELNRTADRNIGLMEERIHTLNRLIGEADRRVSILQKETDKYTRAVGTYRNVRPVRLEPFPGGKRGSQGNEQPAAATYKAEGNPPHGEEKVSREARELGAAGEKREKVVQLYRQGISTEIIASRLGSTVAEIELIISMTGADR